MRMQVFKLFGSKVVGRQTVMSGQRGKRERGVTVAIAAFSFVTFLLAAGLAIDVSHFYLAGTELQNAADAAALAAASSLDSTAGGVTKATDKAVATMNKFEFDKVSVTIARTNVQFAKNISQFDDGTALTEAQATAAPDTVRFVKVTVPPKDVGVYFAKFALNVDTVALTRTAVAGQSESGATGDITPNEVCNVYRITLVEGSSSGDGSLDRTDSNCGSSWKYTQGCTYNVHLTPPCDAQLGYYEILQDDGGVTSYVDWDDRIAQRALQQCFWNGKVVAAYTHPIANNIKNGVNTAFNVYGGGLNSTMFPPDANVKTNITYAQYKAATPGSTYFVPPGGTTGVAGERIMVLPIIKKSSFSVYANGEQANMTIDRFGAFFLVNKVTVNTSNNTADFKLEYIGDRVVTGEARVNPSRTVNSTVAKGVAVPVLYR